MDEQRNLINYTVVCVNEFAREHKLTIKEAFHYLLRFQGILFIKENYEIEHTLPFDTVIEDLGIYCKRNGGKL